MCRDRILSCITLFHTKKEEVTAICELPHQPTIDIIIRQAIGVLAHVFVLLLVAIVFGFLQDNPLRLENRDDLFPLYFLLYTIKRFLVVMTFFE